MSSTRALRCLFHASEQAIYRQINANLYTRNRACRLRNYSNSSTGCCGVERLKEKRFSPRRAVLYVPGNDERKLLKIPGLDVDCAVMDCEDGVAINRKVEARETIKKMLDSLEFGRTECCVRVNAVSSGLMEENLNVEARETIKKMLDSLEFGRTEFCVRVNAVSSGLMEEDLNVEARETIKKMLDNLEFGRTECCVRVNAVSSGLMEEDLNVILQANTLPETIMVPKVNSSQELAAITHSIQSHLKTRYLSHKISLVLFIESAIGLLNLQDICNRATEVSLRSNTYHVDGLVFGSDDFCADIGAKRSVDGLELLYARQKFVLVAKAYRLQAIDMVHIDYKDKEALKEQSVKGANMGFTGKQVIHPSQIPIVQEAFTPSSDQIEWATALIQAFEQHQNTGKGAFTFRGAMIDMPLLLQAQNIVKLSQSIHTANT